ncbi:hypothetical protein WN71_013130 [Streptomyces mangrovisoli]|uniref:Uncharacterized protein n=2 Tax=Streptomyces mangrovisoli TaxID=1428628 RepID=A0A1J4NYF8_9ACTN|nr:hypothetical protein WN71_013130 [Streptomyces mangrovisoli]
MPSYHEIMTADLAALTTAAERWDGMAGEFARQEKAYRRDVHGVVMGPAWQGLSADAAHARFEITLKEFGYAQTEAKAVASLLRDAHAQFTELRGRVVAARSEARAAGMLVSERGRVTLGLLEAEQAERATVHGDADHSKALRHWQDRIDKAVRDVADADAGVRLALKAVVADSDVIAGGRGFNGRAVGDIERYEAGRARDLLRGLADEDRLSVNQLHELERLFRDNDLDTGFSRTVLDGLGPAGTITLTNTLDDLMHGPAAGAGAAAGRAGDYASLERGLADALATATKDTRSPWYRKWRAGMRRAGVRRFATQAQGARLDQAVGYQSLVTLLRKGHGYAPRVLTDLTDDMIAAERREPGIWRLKEAWAGRDGGWFANDPVDGMLGVMSHHPETAAHYLSTGDHMKYLVRDRDWNVVLHAHDGVKADLYTAGPDRDDRAGLGAALQAAATGIDPSSRAGHYVAHTPANGAVLRSAVEHLAATGDDFPPSLRRPMANILVNHGATVHAAMSEVDISRSPLNQHELFEVTKQVSKSEGAYGTLNGGLNQAMVSAIHGHHTDSPEPLVRAGRTVGFLEEARTQAQGDPQTAEFKDKPLFDKAIGFIPVVNGQVQQGFDYVTERWLADEQKRLDDGASKEAVSSYQDRNGQLTALAAEWAKTHQQGGRQPYERQDLVEKSAEAGIDHARGVSGGVGK